MSMVKLYANLRKLAGIKELSVTGSTVGAVACRLVELHPSIKDILFKGGELRSHVIITVNGHNVIDLNASVSEQDVVAIFPPIAGG